MPREITNQNLMEAFCKSIACTGIGAAENKCNEVLPQNVKEVVPESMHEQYPARLLACVNQVCSSEPYGWSVDQYEPEISDETTFQHLYDEWFTEIVWPAE